MSQISNMKAIFDESPLGLALSSQEAAEEYQRRHGAELDLVKLKKLAANARYQLTPDGYMKRLAAIERWRKQHPEKASIYARNGKDRRNKWRKQWRKANPDKAKAAAKRAFARIMKDPQRAEQRREQKRQRYANLTPEQKAKQAKYLRAWKARQSGSLS